MKNVECKKGRIRVLATSIAQIVVGRKTRRERAGAGERASCAGGREARGVRALARGGPPDRISGWREGGRAGSMLPRRIRNPPGYAG